MIHELRTYTFHPGRMPAYLDLARTVGRPVRGNDYGVSHGHWTTEFGTLNQCWHLWSYESHAERDRLTLELARNERWTQDYVANVRPLLARQDIRFLDLVAGIDPPAEPGGVYELRLYRTQVGAAQQWAQTFKSYFPVRERYSKNVGLWTGKAPQPNEVLHMWNYRDVNARMAARAELWKDPGWHEFLGKVAGKLVEMQSILLLPTDFSAMT